MARLPARSLWKAVSGRGGRLLRVGAASKDRVARPITSTTTNGSQNQIVAPKGGTAEDVLEQGARKLLEYVRGASVGSQPVVRLKSPGELKKAFRATGCGLEITGTEEVAGVDELLAAVECVLENSVNTAHPLFFNQLYSRGDPLSILADWMIAATNTNVHTYEVAPVYTVMEAEVLRRCARLIGFEGGYDGLLVPGGSIANLYGMLLARHRADPEWKTRGMNGGPNLVAFTSDHSHYSYKKSAMTMGLGTDNLITIPTDRDTGAMVTEKLEEAILKSKAEGKVPFFVGATAGTTVRGGYDKFDEIADVCSEHGVWMHIDAAWGGGALLSRRQRHTMHGASRTDSYAWNPHKMLGATMQCSIFLTRHKDTLHECNGTSAEYLFQPDKLYTEYDVGDKTIQCGRRADAAKLWLMWKAYGDVGLEKRVDHLYALADHIQERIESSGGKFALTFPRSCTNVGFWYVPRALRPFDFSTADKHALDRIAKVAPYIKNRMQQTGDALIGFQPLDGKPNFFRIVFANADNVTFDDVDQMLERMEAIGEEGFPSKA